MNTETIAVIISAIFGGSGFITAVLTWRQTAKKDELDALSKIIEAVQAENERLRTRLTAVEAELRVYKQYANNLARQLIDLGHSPDAFPKEIPDE